MTFRNYIIWREGLFIPERPPAPGLPRINTNPLTDREREKTAIATTAKLARKVARQGRREIRAAIGVRVEKDGLT